MFLTRRTDEHGRKDFRERDTDQDRERDREREKERRQKERERIRRQDEDRRRRRERQDGENACRKQEEEAKKEKERALEKKKGESTGESSYVERLGKPAKDIKKEESGKRERLRNKVLALILSYYPVISQTSAIRVSLLCVQDRPAIQLYQPGARSRNRSTGAAGVDVSPAPRKPDTETQTVAENEED